MYVRVQLVREAKWQVLGSLHMTCRLLGHTSREDQDCNSQWVKTWNGQRGGWELFARIAEYILADYSANAPPEPEQSSSALPEQCSTALSQFLSANVPPEPAQSSSALPEQWSTGPTELSNSFFANAPPEPEQSSSALPEHAQNTFPFSARLYACSSPVCVKRYVNVLHFARTCIDNALNLQI